MASRRIPLWAVVLATAIAFVAAVGVVVVFGGDDGGSGRTGDDPEQLALAETGELPTSVGDVALGALDGGADRRLGDLLDGRPAVINFFASWCTPCLEEMPAFEAVHRDLGDRVAVVGLAERDTPEAALGIVEETGVTYPTFADETSAAIAYVGGVAMPTTVFVDASGEVVDVTSRALSEDELRAKITDLLGVPA